MTAAQVARKYGFKSVIEHINEDYLKSLGVDGQYEKNKIKFVQPAKNRTYTPDFTLPNGIIVECKGRFLTGDRMKH